MRNIKLTIEYDGKRYSGWQDLEMTIKPSRKIEKVLHQMTNEEIEIIGSGRTDAGTHARGQVANFKTNSRNWTGRNDRLYESLSSARYCHQKNRRDAERFHARYNAVGKKYSYYVRNNVIPSAFESKSQLLFSSRVGYG